MEVFGFDDNAVKCNKILIIQPLVQSCSAFTYPAEGSIIL